MWLNLAVIGIIGIVVIFMASQGLFSAFLHFVCVVAAGAIAFAVWEPVVRLFLGARMPDYAWGLSLMVLFALSLVLLRIVTIKLVPSQVFFGTTVNTVGGGVMGAASGIISCGFIVLGLHMVQSPSEFLGYKGWTIDTTGAVTRVAGAGGNLWVPVDTLTAKFYKYASLGPMYTPNSLAVWYPELDKQANLSQVSINDGEGRQGMAPDHVRVERMWEVDGAAMTNPTPAEFLAQEAGGIDPQTQAPGGQFKVIVVETAINKGAADKGDQLRMTKAQVSLVSRTPETGPDEYQAVYPHAFIQRYATDSADEGRFLFDADGIAASSVGGATDRVILKFEFIVPRTWEPHHLIMRNIRTDLPRTAPTPWTVRDLLALNTGQPAPTAGRATSTKPWLGFLSVLAGTIMILGVTVMDSKRGHQD